MKIDDLKKIIKPIDAEILDLLIQQYEEMFNKPEPFNATKINLSLYELELKYGRRIIKKFFKTDEYLNLYRGSINGKK